MSLRAFHIVFIFFSLCISLGFAVWAFSRFSRIGDQGVFVMGSISAFAFLVLGAYGTWFLRKLQREELLR